MACPAGIEFRPKRRSPLRILSSLAAKYTALVHTTSSNFYYAFFIFCFYFQIASQPPSAILSATKTSKTERSRFEAIPNKHLVRDGRVGESTEGIVSERDSRPRGQPARQPALIARPVVARHHRRRHREERGQAQPHRGHRRQGDRDTQGQAPTSSASQTPRFCAG